MTGFSLCHVSAVEENKNVRFSMDASWCWESDSKRQISGIVYLNHAYSGCHSLRELIMVGYITYIMTDSVKCSGGKTTNQVSREPERFRLPWE